jgi:predicted DNA-binding protein
MAHRTQVYLTEEQRARVDQLAQRKHVTMAEIVRRALDAYLDMDDDFDATFGAARGVRAMVPSRDEWARG